MRPTMTFLAAALLAAAIGCDQKDRDRRTPIMGSNRSGMMETSGGTRGSSGGTR